MSPLRRDRLRLGSLRGAGHRPARAAAPVLDPREAAVSYYVHGRLGWLLTAGLAALGLASLALVVRLARAVPHARAGLWLLGAWAVGVLAGAVFPADPAGRWGEPPSMAGMIHGNAALLAFAALPIAALLLSKGFGPQAPALRGLALAATASLVLFAASLAPVFVRPGPPVLLGASERLLLALYVAWLAAAGAALPDGRRVAAAGRG